MIEVAGVRKAYGCEPVVRDVTLTLPQSGVTSIIGPNGAGKSTLLTMMARLLSMDAGTVVVDGLDVTRTPSAELAKRLSILRQENHLAVRLTVRDLVSFGRYPHSRGRLTADDHAKVDEALAYLDLEPLGQRFLDELSGGQRQRAFVAMVLCQGTDHVLLDEPLNNLDMRHAVEMMRLVRRAADDLGRSVVLVLHDINFASRWSDHVIAMRDGEVVVAGPPSEVIDADVLRRVFDVEVDVREIDGARVGLYYG